VAAKQKKSKQTPQATASCRATHVALLRGVNVGGKNRLPMSELVKFFAKAGCAEVRSYIQSGNVLFSADDPCAKRVPELVEQQIEKKFGFRSPVILRSAEEMSTLVASNPLKCDQAALYVGFLTGKPTSAQIAALDPNRSPGDQYQIVGREIYMILAGNGAAKTKLTTAYFDSKLATTSTFRNWRTTTTLLAMMTGAPT
jgi:uncharacterized protein (DUF1697 family)